MNYLIGNISIPSKKVGQAVDLVIHGKNGWIAKPENAEGLAQRSK